MNVVDSSGWIEYFINGSNANSFAPPIRDISNLIVPSICIYEVFKRGLLELDGEEALKTIGHMSLGEIVEWDRNIAIHAAQTSLEFKLAMADSIILATARLNNAKLWTQDEHFKGLEDVKYIEKR